MQSKLEELYVEKEYCMTVLGQFCQYLDCFREVLPVIFESLGIIDRFGHC